MKKIFVLLAVLVVVGVSVSSCRSSKPPCPAYKTQIEEAPQTPERI